MNNNNLYQIYHVARCGSTLLSALLSNCCQTFSEPRWTKDLFLADSCSEAVIQNFGSIVKMQSISTRIGFKPPGPKVFLYRPLAHHLLKMSEATVDWINTRKEIYGKYFLALQGNELLLEPETIMQLHTIFWASCVIEMKKTEDVMWIRSNDFFTDKEGTARAVLEHFGIDGDPDMRFSQINVKSLRLNGGGIPIQPFEDYITETTETISDDRGIISTEIALENSQIVETIEWAKENIDLDSTLYY